MQLLFAPILYVLHAFLSGLRSPTAPAESGLLMLRGSESPDNTNAFTNTSQPFSTSLFPNNLDASLPIQVWNASSQLNDSTPTRSTPRFTPPLPAPLPCHSSTSSATESDIIEHAAPTPIPRDEEDVNGTTTHHDAAQTFGFFNSILPHVFIRTVSLRVRKLVLYHAVNFGLRHVFGHVDKDAFASQSVVEVAIEVVEGTTVRDTVETEHLSRASWAYAVVGVVTSMAILLGTFTHMATRWTRLPDKTMVASASTRTSGHELELDELAHSKTIAERSTESAAIFSRLRLGHALTSLASESAVIHPEGSNHSDSTLRNASLPESDVDGCDVPEKLRKEQMLAQSLSIMRKITINNLKKHAPPSPDATKNTLHGSLTYDLPPSEPWESNLFCAVQKSHEIVHPAHYYTQLTPKQTQHGEVHRRYEYNRERLPCALPTSLLPIEEETEMLYSKDNLHSEEMSTMLDAKSASTQIYGSAIVPESSASPTLVRHIKSAIKDIGPDEIPYPLSRTAAHFVHRPNLLHPWFCPPSLEDEERLRSIPRRSGNLSASSSADALYSASIASDSGEEPSPLSPDNEECYLPSSSSVGAVYSVALYDSDEPPPPSPEDQQRLQAIPHLLKRLSSSSSAGALHSAVSDCDDEPSHPSEEDMRRLRSIPRMLDEFSVSSSADALYSASVYEEEPEDASYHLTMGDDTSLGKTHSASAVSDGDWHSAEPLGLPALTQCEASTAGLVRATSLKSQALQSSFDIFSNATPVESSAIQLKSTPAIQSTPARGKIETAFRPTAWSVLGIRKKEVKRSLAFKPAASSKPRGWKKNAMRVAASKSMERPAHLPLCSDSALGSSPVAYNMRREDIGVQSTSANVEHLRGAKSVSASSSADDICSASVASDSDWHPHALEPLDLPVSALSEASNAGLFLLKAPILHNSFDIFNSAKPIPLNDVPEVSFKFKRRFKPAAWSSPNRLMKKAAKVAASKYLERPAQLPLPSDTASGPPSIPIPRSGSLPSLVSARDISPTDSKSLHTSATSPDIEGACCTPAGTHMADKEYVVVVEQERVTGSPGKVRFDPVLTLVRMKKLSEKGQDLLHRTEEVSRQIDESARGWRALLRRARMPGEQDALKMKLYK